MRKKQLIAGIDVGTTKICSVIARLQAGAVELLGVGVHPSKGLKKGIVVNLSETTASIKASLELAEKASGMEVDSAYVGIGGRLIRGLNRHGKTDVRGRNQEISSDDISRAVAIAANSKIPDDFQVIHVLTQDFRVDGQDGIVNPLGMLGRQLGVKLHVVLNASAVVRNIINAVNRADLVVDGVVMQQLASSEAILSEDEKEMGVLVVDIGGGTTDVAVYARQAVWHSQVLPLGGSLITKDLALGLKIPVDEAEKVKQESGCVYPESVPSEEFVEVSEVGTRRRRTVSRRQICRIIQARCDEMLEAIGQIREDLGISRELLTGVVLTGGGSLLEGLADRAEQILGAQVRIGYPVNVVESSSPYCDPRYSTALGIVEYSRNVRSQDMRLVQAGRSERSGVGRRVADWLLQKIGFVPVPRTGDQL